MKTEIKEEALDFSSTTLSENHQSDSVTPSAGTNNSIEEEARMYLDAFTRSANLSWQQTPEEPMVSWIIGLYFQHIILSQNFWLYSSTYNIYDRNCHYNYCTYYVCTGILLLLLFSWGLCVCVCLQETAASEGRPFVCPICQKSFAKAAILKRHHLAHFRPYVCHICTRSFTRREVLAEHLLEHNGADLRMPCPVCGMTIKRKRNLQAHIKVKHPDYYRQSLTKKESNCWDCQLGEGVIFKAKCYLFFSGWYWNATTNGGLKFILVFFLWVLFGL